MALQQVSPFCGSIRGPVLCPTGDLICPSRWCQRTSPSTRRGFPVTCGATWECKSQGAVEVKDRRSEWGLLTAALLLRLISLLTLTSYTEVFNAVFFCWRRLCFFFFLCSRPFACKISYTTHRRKGKEWKAYLVFCSFKAQTMCRIDQWFPTFSCALLKMKQYLFAATRHMSIICKKKNCAPLRICIVRKYAAVSPARLLL